MRNQLIMNGYELVSAVVVLWLVGHLFGGL